MTHLWNYTTTVGDLHAVEVAALPDQPWGRLKDTAEAADGGIRSLP